MNHLDGKAAVEAKAKMQEKAKRRELFAKQGKTLAKFSTSGTCVLTGSLRPRQRTLTGRLQVILKPPSTSAVLRRYEPRGLATKGPSKPSSLPATNTSPKVVFKINGNAATHNLQEALQVELRKREKMQLETVFERMDVSKDGKVCASDIDATLRALGHTPGADEVSGMLWEVDDDTKGHLTAEDYHASYYRIRESRELDEPRTWFRLVEFMMIDEDGDGTVEFDEAAKIFRARYGKEAVERVQAMFAGRAESLGGSDGAVRFKPMSYADFLTSMKLLVPGS